MINLIFFQSRSIFQDSISDLRSLFKQLIFYVEQHFVYHFSDNNDAKPNNVESAASSAGANAGDPYAASVSAALSSMNINPGAGGGGAGGPNPSTSTMNNGQKDTTHSDVQKLQEQLNDIKEQVYMIILK